MINCSPISKHYKELSIQAYNGKFLELKIDERISNSSELNSAKMPAPILYPNRRKNLYQTKK